jgi:hypothetical protein
MLHEVWVKAEKHANTRCEFSKLQQTLHIMTIKNASLQIK